jgi:endonuclease-3 related protein
MQQTLEKIYNFLLAEYGSQGWWPLTSYKGTNPTKTGFIQGYHPKDYTHPQKKQDQFEIIIGTLLTQNTAWSNVEKSLINLKRNNLLCPKKISKSSQETIANLIKPSGYHNQKSERLILIAKWFLTLNKIPTRKEILSLKGIGQETADSILLYAFKKPEFVIDTYTKRIFSNLKLINPTEKYETIKALFENHLNPCYKIFQEYHALLVEHAKRYYTKKETYKLDPLLKIIDK